ncbi:penicillin-binding protein 2 [Patescibacteria group bacterium]|nr:penicillin-binding protein 2 [Patescibacteria group bacterium]MCG2699536.1 penicillin-binding protein 2 [Candidatus Parcubacteria bacterium]
MNFNKYKISNVRGDIEPHEVFLDKLAKAKEEEWGITQKKFEVPLQEKLAYIIFVIFVLAAILLFSKVFYLQIIQGEGLAALSENNRIRIQFLSAERGVIYDSNLKQLVFNNPAFDLICDKRDLLALSLDSVKEIEEVAAIISKDPEVLKKEIEESDRSQVLIYENLPQETLVILETRIKDFPGFEIVKNTVRDYVQGPLLSHLMGYLNKINKKELETYKNYSISDYIGRSGVERSYEEILRGAPGVVKIEKDVFGREKNRIIESTPEAGKSLVLYLDFDLQNKLTEELEKRLGMIGLKKAAAVALDPKTGGILAMVSLPGFDNNIFSKGISVEDFQRAQNNPLKPFFNRAIAGQYPIGSTIKPVIASAALEEKIISSDKQIYDLGYIEIKSSYDPNIVYRYSGLEAPGYYDMRKAIADSSNIYFYTVGGGYRDQEGLGPTLIKKYLEFFGWGQKTQVDLPGEAKGFVPWPEWKVQTKGENWWDGDTYHLSIGQGALTVTPLQVASAFAVIANGGTLYQPQAVKEIVSTSSGSIQSVQKIAPQVLREGFIDPANLEVVREGMRQGVTSPTGTGRVLQILPVAAASKTGTAQLAKDNYYDIWVTVFAPYEDPEIVLTIVIEDVEGLHVPSLMVAQQVLDWYFRR